MFGEFFAYRTNNNSTNELELYVTLANETPRIIKMVNGTKIPWNQWIHIAISYNQSTLSKAKIFIDGNQEGESITLSKNIPSFKDAVVYLGNNKNNSAAFNGAITEFRLRDKSLDELLSQEIEIAIALLKVDDDSAVKTALNNAKTAVIASNFATASTELQTAIDEVSSLDNSSYTTAEKEAITTAIKAAKTVADELLSGNRNSNSIIKG